MDKIKTVGQQFREIMAKNGKTQDEIAKMLEIDPRSVSQTFASFDGESCRVKTIKRYADALGYDVVIKIKRRNKGWSKKK